MAACVFQHELDHLDGILLSDIGLEIDDDYINASQEEKDEVINWYLDTLDLKAKEVQKEIDDNPELKEIQNGIDFMTSVYKGETQIEKFKKEE